VAENLMVNQEELLLKVYNSYLLFKTYWQFGDYQRAMRLIE
jgi:hypothetical protein